MSGFVPYDRREDYLLHALPPAIRETLANAALTENTSLTNVVGAILAARYGIEFEPSRRPLKKDLLGRDSVYLRLPPAVLQGVRREARRRRVTIRSMMLLALAEGFGLEAPEVTKEDPARRSGRPRVHGRPRGRKGART